MTQHKSLTILSALALALLLASLATPVAAQDSFWGEQYNFGFGLQGWEIIYGDYNSPNVVSNASSGQQRLEIRHAYTGRVENVMVAYQAACSHTVELWDDNTKFHDSTASSGSQVIDWQGSRQLDSGYLRIVITGSGCPAQAFYTSQVYVIGYGVNPSGLPATAMAFDVGGIYGGLEQANQRLQNLPGTILNSVPIESGSALFGYIKWLASPSSADELAGPFAPIISHGGLMFSMVIASLVIYGLVYGIVFIIRFVIWLFKIVLSLIDIALQIAQVVGSAVGGFIKAIFR